MPSIFRFRFLTTALFAVCASQACAEPVTDAQSAIMQGKYERAVEILRPAADRGNASAQLVLGNLYRRGWGVAEDPRAAAAWYEKSAEQGNIDAQFSLGELFYSGAGVKKSHERAALWFRRAATSGKATAPAPQYLLGLMYQKGEGVKPDLIAAHMWLSIASLNAVAPATKSEYASAGQVVERRMTSSQINAARDRARECLASEYARC
jgi:uncharacterized protein